MTVVLDVGKTVAKLSLWTAGGALVTRRTRANDSEGKSVVAGLDVDAIETWMAEVLSDFAKLGPIGAIIPVAHGAAAVVVRDGRQLAPPRDYEQPIAANVRAQYDRLRDPFDKTGSPALPDGLNLGAQLFCLQRDNPHAFDQGTVIHLLPQYWAWELSGVAASEVTSLGCHSDLWHPSESCFSNLARDLGWAACVPPLRHASDVLGKIRQSWVERTGLPSDVSIHCGLHDSNAALLAARGFSEIAEHEATVLSTGTWFVAMRTPYRGQNTDISTLAEMRDCLVNVDVHGTPIPSARFMGGREIESLIGIDTRRIDIKPDQQAILQAASQVIRKGAMVLPTYASGVGPFRSMAGQWIEQPTDMYEVRAAVSLYAALVANVSLDLIGARDRILVEGRFAEAEVFVRALASLRPDTKIYVANAHNDVSYGALRLVYPDLPPPSTLRRIDRLDQDLDAYQARWQERVSQAEFLA
jgi:sugar (pentulose or hexulose) kinase